MNGDYIRNNRNFEGVIIVVNREDNRDKQNAEYIEQMCYEFSNLLYEVMKENEKAYQKLKDENEILERKCKQYEEQLLSPNVSKAPIQFLIKLRRWLGKKRKQFKDTAINTGKTLYSLGKKISIKLGIKDSLKKTALFNKLYSSGMIDRFKR